jgi:hypothetical protein
MAVMVVPAAVAMPRQSRAISVRVPVAGTAGVDRSVCLGSLPHVPILRALATPRFSLVRPLRPSFVIGQYDTEHGRSH